MSMRRTASDANTIRRAAGWSGSAVGLASAYLLVGSAVILGLGTGIALDLLA